MSSPWGGIPASVVRQDGAVGILDHPRIAASVRDGVPVTGWVVMPGQPAARVDAIVEGQGGNTITRSSLRTHVPRPDAVPGLGAEAAFGGYHGFVPLPPDAPERVWVRVEAVGADGARWTSGQREVLVHQPRATAQDLRRIPELLGPVRAADTRDAARILVVTHDLGLGGGQLYLHELLRRLVHEHRFEPLVLAPRGGTLAEPLHEWGVGVRIHSGLGVRDESEWATSAGVVADAAREHRAGSVLVNTLGCAYAVDGAAWAGLPAVWAVHESFPLAEFRAIVSPPDGGSPALVARWGRALTSAAAVVFEADATRELFTDRLRPGRGVTVRYGIDTEPLAAHRRGGGEAAPAGASLGTDPLVLLCIGTFEQRKGQALLVDAFARSRTAGRPAVLVLVGASDNEYTTLLRERIARLGLDDDVRLVPLTPDLDQWYATADVLVSVSDVESMPRTMLEGMARGLPVLSCGVFGVPELVRDGETGWLFPDRDQQAASAAISRVLALPDEAIRAAGARARDLVLSDFDSRGYGDAYARLLRGLAADPCADPVELLER